MEVVESGKGELLQPPDIEGFRRWMREKKSMALENKLMSEKEAVSRFIKDGDYIGFELYGTVRAPLSIVREIVRQGKRNLRLAGQGLQDVDFLVAAGLVEAMDLTYVGYEVYGLSPILRRAAESGKLKIVEWSNAAMAWRFKAASMGIPFIPVRSMAGSDTFKYSAAKVATDPFTGIKVVLLPALILDVGIIHVHRADIYGNAQIEGILGFAHEMARASKRLIISAEEIVDTEEIRKYPDRTIIPYFIVDAVVHAPFGSHPGEMVYLYGRDEEHIKAYIEAIKTEDGTRAYLEKYIYNVKDHSEYLKVIGEERLNYLKSIRMGR
jgi:acyl CoA:acetate/3-ketoacid CoA transferase alpha subunit